MHVLFLDIDGVLKVIGDKTDWSRNFTKSCVFELNRITSCVDLKIVIHSKWKDEPAINGFTLSHKISILQNYFIKNKVDQYIYHITPNLGDYERKGLEIRDFLLSVGYKRGDRYLVIDDVLEHIKPVPHYIITDPKTGLTPEIADKIIHYFRTSKENK